jgi:EAL and modified HD-GYP domain-containing signal transduction protein
MTRLNVDSRETLYVARQPILDKAGTVYGYALLYRDLPEYEGEREDHAGARVLTDAVLGLGLDTITGGKPAFLNLTRPLLLRLSALLPPSAAVFELQRDIPVNDETFETCRTLHESGYSLALDDFRAGAGASALLPFVKFVKVDAGTTSAAGLAGIARYLGSSPIKLVAEHVASEDAFTAARGAGYHLFQGPYFSNPTVCSRAAVPGRIWPTCSCLRR